MKVTLLGTGTSQGVPVIACTCEACQSLDYRDKRLRTSIHIEKNGTSLVVDTGPDFRQQMLRERISRLDAIIYTHEHKDHTAGLDDVRAFNFRQKKDMPIYGRPQVIDQLRQEFSYAFAEKKYPGVPQIEVHHLENTPINIEGIDILPIEVLHYKLPVFGFRIDDFTYITDANYISDEEKEKIKGTKVLVVNALQREEHISHYNVAQATALANEMGAEITYFTHISHRMGPHKKAEEDLPDHIRLGYDGLVIEL